MCMDHLVNSYLFKIDYEANHPNFLLISIYR